MAENFNSYYTGSHALIIGINIYKHASPLLHARNDAEGLAAVLIEKFSFPRENVRILLDNEATASNIRDAYADFSLTKPDDKIIFFFAGHGYKTSGHRGDVGFLVPYDGNASNISTLIRWEEFVTGVDLFPAKHIFFIVDSCFSGLFLKRVLSGRKRFVTHLLGHTQSMVPIP